MTLRRVEALSSRGHPYAYWEMVVPRIPDELRDCIVYLYRTEDDAKAGKVSGGTGFLVELNVSASGIPFRYLITNTHVLDKGGHWARFNTKDGGSDQIFLPPAAWFHHSGTADISATALEFRDQWAVRSLDWEKYGVNRAGLPTRNVGIGDEVFMLGKFMGHDGIQRNAPLARFGNIAMMPDPEILIEDGRGKMVEGYLLDMHSLPGFSGSPVFLHLTGGTHRGDGTFMPFNVEITGLIGIDTGHKLISGTIIDRRTDLPVCANWKVWQNSGISIVAPAWQIFELLKQEDFVDQRNERELQWFEDHEHSRASSDMAEDDPGSLDRTADVMGKLLQVPKAEADEVHRGHQE